MLDSDDDTQRARRSPRAGLRELALALERLVAEGLASGVVRGAAQELDRDSASPELQRLMGDLLSLVRGLEQGASAHPPFPPGAWTEQAAQGAVRGGVAELKRSLPRVNEATREVLDALNHLLQRASDEAELRAEDQRAPGSRMRAVAAGALEGAVEQFESSMPRLEPLATRLASLVGRGLVVGLTEALEQSVAADGALRRTGATVARDTGRVLSRAAARLEGPAVVVAGLAAVTAVAFAWRRARG